MVFSYIHIPKKVRLLFEKFPCSRSLILKSHEIFDCFYLPSSTSLTLKSPLIFLYLYKFYVVNAEKVGIFSYQLLYSWILTLKLMEHFQIFPNCTKYHQTSLNTSLKSIVPYKLFYVINVKKVKSHTATAICCSSFFFFFVYLSSS